MHEMASNTSIVVLSRLVNTRLAKFPLPTQPNVCRLHEDPENLHNQNKSKHLFYVASTRKKIRFKCCIMQLVEKETGRVNLIK